MCYSVYAIVRCTMLRLFCSKCVEAIQNTVAYALCFAVAYALCFAVAQGNIMNALGYSAVVHFPITCPRARARAHALAAEQLSNCCWGSARVQHRWLHRCKTANAPRLWRSPVARDFSDFSAPRSRPAWSCVRACVCATARPAASLWRAPSE